MEYKNDNMGGLKSTKCGIESLDGLLGGFKTPAIILVAGTAGVGKTTMALQMLSGAEKDGEKALYIPITTEKTQKLDQYNASLGFVSDAIHVHPMNRQLSERDPLSTLIDIGNVIDTVKPDRLVIDPVTPLGFGFVEQERRRFFYTLDSILQERDMLTLLIGEMVKEELHRAVISHLADGIIYLSRADNGTRADHHMEILKMRGIGPGKRSDITSSKYLYEVSSSGFTVYPHLRPETDFILDDSRTESGIAGLDSMIGGGMIRYSSTLVAGRPGTGKKIFGLQFIYHGLKAGESGMIITFEDSPHQLLMDAKHHGWDMEPFIANGMLSFICANPANIYPAEHALRIRSGIEGKNIRRVFFDGVNNLEISIPDHLEMRGYLHSLTGYLKSKNITSFFITDTEPSVHPGEERIDYAYLMDSVVILHSSTANNRMYMYLIKSRGTKHRNAVREYSITEDGIKLRSDPLMG